MKTKKDCFAYDRFGVLEVCTALDRLDCEGCNFYICREEYEARRKEMNEKRRMRKGER